MVVRSSKAARLVMVLCSELNEIAFSGIFDYVCVTSIIEASNQIDVTSGFLGCQPYKCQHG